MKKNVFLVSLLFPATLCAGVPDSVYVRPTALPRGEGLMLQWSSDARKWENATQGRILGSDYGTWGREKKFYAPSMAQGGDGLLAVVFQVNDYTNQFAVATTRDFIHWRPQDYPYMQGVGQCLAPVVQYSDGQYTVTFHNKEGKYYKTTTRDLIHFSAPQPVAQGAEPQTLRLHRHMISAVHDNQVAFGVKAAREAELAQDDATRFAGLQTVNATLSVDVLNPLAISDKLMGIFFEDINYAADGGLWAELVQNGDFEYDPHDRMGDRNWNASTAWSLQGEATLDYKALGVSQNNSHAVRMTVTERQLGAALCNHGWDGIAVKKGAKYNLSLSLQGGSVEVALIDGDRTLAKATLKGGKQWKDVKAVLRPTADCNNAQLSIRPLKAGSVTMDMVSLLPQDTYKGHGLRRDLCETLAALKPRFMRFPGGCVAHGDGLHNMYNWKETIGPLRDRKPQRNIWGYHQSRRMGYFEFFQFCEDMGMEPLPIVPAGVPCQNSSDGGGGQQGGIPMEQMGAYIQDVLDLIEWANGDATTEWGRKRIAQGHKAPFGLKMLGIGNEDLISPTFTERYLMICKAVHEKYPEIKVCGTSGPFYYGSDYDEGWRLATENKDVISLVDEHYYLSPGWFIYNQNYYDHYDRQAPHVYLGEWAAHLPNRRSTIETALAEALYYCSLERNGDVVEMSSYAPLLAKEGHTQWNPDMIYFNNTEVKPTVGYYAQMMCGQSSGNEYLPTSFTTPERRHGVAQRLAASTVRDTKTGAVYLKLVNLLPVEANVQLQLGSLLPAAKTCAMTRLSGNYDSTTARPEQSEVTLAPDGTLQIPAYSFTLIAL